MMDWKRMRRDPPVYQLSDASGRVLAEVQHERGGWAWYRVTRFSEGVPPGAGWEDDLARAKRMACWGIETQRQTD